MMEFIYIMKEKDRDLEAYQLSAYAMEQIGINNGLLTKLHQNYYKEDDYEKVFAEIDQ